MKSKSGWNSDGNGNNSCGFNGFPGGYRDHETGFFLAGKNAGFWTATASDTTNECWVRDLGFNYPELGASLYSKSGGFSVRCIKN
jgi:uncharacterized protein (TIGR02145 family)